MKVIPQNIIYESDSTLICLADDPDKGRVALKVLKEDYPPPSRILHFENEYEQTAGLDIPGVRKIFRKDKAGGKLALVMEYVPGIPIREYFLKNLPDIEIFLRLAIRICTALDSLHRQNLLHKDINGNNIIYDAESGDLHLIDFELAAPYNYQGQNARLPEKLEGTLGYIAPEQTGKMNRPVDQRTDLYSLGVTLYELLTGRLPFEAKNPMELVHAHMATRPVAPSALRTDVPEVISAILLKLLEKNAFERYQSASGLKTDLERALSEILANGTASDFPLAQTDSFASFALPDRLFGREKEVRQLLDICRDVFNPEESKKGNGSALVLVSGYTGVGKTALVREIHQPVSERYGYLVEGQFDQLKADIPYHAWIEAFSEFVNILLTENISQLEAWKSRILDAVGDNGRLITDVLPDLELITGKQSATVDLDGVEAQNRFNQLLFKFIEAISHPEHPLVIFLDNIQWADAASLELLRLLLTRHHSSRFVIIGAYRDHEMETNGLLASTLADLERAGVSTLKVHLENLPPSAVRQLIAASLSTDPEMVRSLAETVYSKTLGNPFFVRQILQNIYSEGLLKPMEASPTGGTSAPGWTWDQEKVEQMNITDNVASYMADKLRKLPESSLNLLKLAASIGNRFEVSVLLEVSGLALEDIKRELVPAVKEGLILLSEGNYRFSHDRIRKAAYSLISQEEAKEKHLSIGRAFLKTIPPDKREERIFEIVNQWNSGISLIQKRREKIQLAELNLVAGQKASAASAYKAAYKHLQTGVQLVEPYGWQNLYKMNLALFNEAAEAAFLVGDYEESSRLVQVIISQTVTVLDRVPAYQLLIKSLTAQNKLAEALEQGRAILRLLGVRLPSRPTWLHVFVDFLYTRILRSRYKVESLADLPEMMDPNALAIHNIFASMGSSSFFLSPLQYPISLFKQIRLALTYGNGPAAADVYIGYAVFLLQFTGKAQLAERFGKLAMEIINKQGAEDKKSFVFFGYYGTISHLLHPARDGLNLLREVLHGGARTGNPEGKAFAAIGYIGITFFSGIALPVLKKEIPGLIAELSPLRNPALLTYLRMSNQLVLNLEGESETPTILSGTAFNEDDMLSIYIKPEDIIIIFVFHYFKFLLSFLFGDTAEAYIQTKKAEGYLEALGPGMHTTTFIYYDSLIRIAAFREGLITDKAKTRRHLKENRKKLKYWAKDAPMNYRHRYFLVEAEWASIRGEPQQARELYDLAIEDARANEYIQDEALACELAGRFNSRQNRLRLASYYIQNATYAYRQWGALAKATQLEDDFPQFFARSRRNTTGTTDISTSDPGTGANRIDLEALLNANLALAGEIVLTNLLEKMMRIVIGIAGAEKGSLVLFDRGKWILRAQGDTDSGIRFSQDVCTEENGMLPLSVINFAARKKQVVVLDDARNDRQHGKDPYIRREEVRSALCLPILNKGKLAAVIYLENNLSEGVFTPDRLEVLNILSSQIATSLENALLYENLEEKVKERTTQVVKQNREIQEKNKALSSALDQLKSAQSQLVESEKMASLGQLTAGVAHEINNPINFVSGNIEPLKRDVQDLMEILALYDRITAERSLQAEFGAVEAFKSEVDYEYLVEEIHNLLDGIEEGASRTTRIVKGLRNFSRLDEEEFKMADVNEGIESTLLVLGNGMRKNEIELKLELGEMPLIQCLPGKLNQVFMNVITNAIHATGLRPNREIPAEIRIRTERLSGEPESIRISIADNGPGIPEKIRNRIFEPFFTTKDVGEGTGLGLAISYGIIENHNGRIEAFNQDGKGAVFHIYLPVSQP
jgi:predicted ATPase/signal transduction histidine kinase